MKNDWNKLSFNGRIIDISETLLDIKKYGIDSFEAEFEADYAAIQAGLSEDESDELFELIKAKYPSVEHLIEDVPVVQPEVNVPKCPTCGSTDLIKKGVGARAVDGFVFGRLSVEGRSQFQCRKCGYMW